MNFCNKDRDPLENLKFYEKEKFGIVEKDKLPDYKSQMRPEKFQETFWNLYLKNEDRAKDQVFTQNMSIVFNKLLDSQNAF